MRIIPKDEFVKDILAYADMLHEGAVFIYPTDTLYGIGCDARRPGLIQRVRNIKINHRQAMSVIAPSKKWIKDNLVYKKEFDEWFGKLPGPYTLIMEVKNKECVYMQDVNPHNNTLGVRIPNHWIADVVKKLGFPIITTSLNIHGEPPCKSLAHISHNIKIMTDFAIDEGIIDGKPSTLIDLTQTPPKIIERK
ncbi:MAG: L-threonylcarbamoyladenylate synthase [Candidatus Woesearchaeota archaeon]